MTTLDEGLEELPMPGAIPVWALSGRPSHSADQARLLQIRRDLALTPEERMIKALSLGAAATGLGNEPADEGQGSK